MNALARLAGAGKVRMASAGGVAGGARRHAGLGHARSALVNAAPGTVRFVMDRHLAERLRAHLGPSADQRREHGPRAGATCCASSPGSGIRCTVLDMDPPG